jgi:aminoglycoside phosphotransferase (APT) family kinase protein
MMTMMAELPHGDLLRAVRGYASEVAGCPPEHITAVSRFDDGNRHAVYKVSHLDDSGAPKDVVVRVSNLGSEAECAQGGREALALERTGGVGAPILHDFRCRSRWFETPTMCMAYVPGPPIDLSTASPAEVSRLGSVVAWVHGRPTDGLTDLSSAPGTVGSYAERRLASVLSTLDWARDPLPGPVQARLRTTAGAVRQGWETVRDTESFLATDVLALLHGDIAQGNVLWDTGPVLIDWEYVRVGDPADEIAYLFDQNGLSAHQREAFWRGYGEVMPGQATLGHVVERVGWWEPLTLLGSTLWWVERWVRRTESEAAGRIDPDLRRDAGYYLDRVIRRLDRLENVTARG